jgi:general secretion pathway protein F
MPAARVIFRKSGSAPVRAGARVPSAWGKKRTHPTSKQRLPFLKALSGLINGGYPSGEAVRLLAHRVKDPQLRSIAQSMWERVSGGTTLSDAMEEWPELFDLQITNLIRAGEATGSLRDVLRRLIAHLAGGEALRRKLINALCYPCFICVLATGMLIFFVTFLVPRLQALLNSLGGRLPFATRVLIDTAHLMVAYGPLALVALAMAAGGLVWWWKTPAGRLWSDKAILRTPLAGPLVIESTIQGFSETLAVLLENGVTTVEALKIAERTIGNRSMGSAFRTATAAIVEGQSVLRALAKVPYMPDYVIDALIVGENTGKLAPHLRDLSESMKEEIAQRLDALTSIVSTAVLFGAFSFVGFLAYGVVSALLQVSSSFKI